MLRFKRKQMATIGNRSMHARTRAFVLEHFPALRTAPADALDAELDALLAEAHGHGLRSQRAAALFVLANCAMGRQAVARDPGVRSILAARERPLADRALLLETWLTQAWGSLQRMTPR
ncbi:hypothetical protein LDO26_06790 [Luteimonas sp. BDR2-5]|uniref:hypothetical protein n=1 Tax=Proluteimonas luteida TaxID=2878685 RepID=UPI001E3FA786|nr:hypothetical protein [Luteimonas sp. BDR2-5]MCD9027911.1 hypothetical protein [Luteimonas sp. BDR2-5]